LKRFLKPILQQEIHNFLTENEAFETGCGILENRGGTPDIFPFKNMTKLCQ
jgi:hypothetical protein